MEIKIIDRLISKHASWDDLYKDLSTNNKFTQKFKGDVFERLTQAYLLTMPEYQSILINVWLNQEVPRNVLKKLNLPAEDFGVDLIAKTNRNEYWTIQCKFKSTKSSLTYKELSTFSTLSFVNAKNISLGIVSHSSNKPIRNRKFLGNISEIGLDRWLNLSADEWKNIRNFCKHKPVKLVKRKPRSHQLKAINLSRKYFVKNKESKGKLIMPCATGKSLTAFWIAQAIDVKKIIVAVPSLNLVKQSLNDWTKEYLAHGITPEWLCVCSDESAGKVDIDEFNTDTYDLGIPTTTDKKEIVSFLKKRSKNPKIVFTTYQSSPRLAESARAAKVSFEFAILDEAHKTVGMKEKSFSTLLFDKKIKIKKRLFMTATERVLRGRKNKVVSMTDPKVYGEDIFVMTFKDAIDQDIISDYKILTIAVSDNEVDALIEDNRYITKGNSDSESSAKYLAAGIALKKTFKKYKIKHAISFHRSIKLAKEFQEQQDELNKIKSMRPIVQNLHISSKKTSGQRVELIKEFTEQNRSLLTNARCLTEGVDVPAIDCVMFVDPKQSVIDIVQAAGRALRKFDGKNFGYILLPIVVPDDIDLQEFADTTAFKKITSIIAALSSQDERIAEELRLEKKGKTSSGKIINIDSRIKLSKKIDLENFAKSIQTKIWEKVAKVNFKSYEESRSFARSLGLKKHKEWVQYVKNKDFPKDIPHNPEGTYLNKGWNGWGDWLGTGNIHRKDIVYRSFNEARKYAQGLNLKSGKYWFEATKKKNFPNDIPAYPAGVYKNKGWKGMGDWLGTGRIATQDRVYLPFKEARNFAHSLQFSSVSEWNDYCKTGKRPKNIPSQPKSVYKNDGWKGYPNWLGYETLSFYDARNFVRKLGLKSSREWIEYTKNPNFPNNIPKTPLGAYKNKGWKGMGDWLGTGRIATQDRVYLPFKEARQYARSLKLKKWEDWYELYKNNKLPSDMPRNPHQTYKDKGWKNVSDWLNLEKKLNFIEARAFVRKLGLKNTKDWEDYTKSESFPSFLRKSPSTYMYTGDWKGMPDWLGTSSQKFKSFKAARKYARSLNLKSSSEWNKFTKNPKFPKDIPKTPSLVYKKKGWKGFPDWLGNNNVAPQFMVFKSFKAARKYARSLNLKSSSEWNKFTKNPKFPKDIPRAPSYSYKDKGWINWSDWLGKN